MLILPIQWLRAAAAFAIAVLHGLHETGLLAAATGRDVAVSVRLPWSAGVDVFFVVSGFVMVVASGRLFGRTGGRRLFLARRVARVVPLYWLVTTLYLALALLAPALLNGLPPSAGYVAASYLFWPMARPDGLVQPLYSLGWTLNYEMAFYGLFALALGLPRRAAIPALLLGLVGLAAIGVVAPLPLPFRFLADPIVIEFGFGLLIGFWRVEGIRIGRPARLVLAVSAGLLLVSVGVAGDLSGATRAILWGVPAACLVAAGGLGHDDPWEEEGRLARLGAALGDASYALYLIHPFVLRGLREAAHVAGLAPAVPPLLFLVLALLGTLVAAHLVHRWIERPMTGAVRTRLERLAVNRSGDRPPPRPGTATP